MKKCTFCWFLLHTYITMHGSKNVKATCLPLRQSIQAITGLSVLPSTILLSPMTYTYCLHAQGRSAFYPQSIIACFVRVLQQAIIVPPQNHQHIYGCTMDVQYRSVPSKQANHRAPNSRKNTILNNENGFTFIVILLWMKQRENWRKMCLCSLVHSAKTSHGGCGLKFPAVGLVMPVVQCVLSGRN